MPKKYKKNWRARAFLMRTIKHLIDALNDYLEFYQLAVGDHPEWAEDLRMPGDGVALAIESMQAIYKEFWGDLPETWETHH